MAAPLSGAGAMAAAFLRPSPPKFLSPKPHLPPQSSLHSNSSPNIINLLRERGLLESTTSETLAPASSNPTNPPLKAYCGFDPTAESLHLGNLLGLIVLRWFRRCGHQAVALIGGATARIGDPSGKTRERPGLSAQAVARNSAAITALLQRILKSDEIPVVDNYEWWREMTLMRFLGEVGRHARVGAMLGKESVRKRMAAEEGVSYTEFSYQLLQGYDFLHMFRDMGVNVQVGGSDQWGNITAGTELVRRILRVDDGVYGLTFPLLLKGDGSKFGKSEDGAVWLSPSMLSPYKFYQYFFSVPDADVVRFLKILTFLELEEIGEVEEGMGRAGYVPNSAQRRLAEEVTRFVHGEEGLVEAVKATEALKPGAGTELDAGVIEEIARDVPSCSLPYDQVLNSLLVEVSVICGFLGSKSAARRLVKQGGLYLNNRRVDDEGKVIEEFDIVGGRLLLLSAGKKNKMVIMIS